MGNSIWTPSVVAIKFNVENCVLLKQRETNDFHTINCSVYPKKSVKLKWEMNINAKTHVI